VVVDHLLAELLDPIVGRLLAGEPAELDLGHPPSAAFIANDFSAGMFAALSAALREVSVAA
jgi:hypothetical protein